MALLITACVYEIAANLFRWPTGRLVSLWLLVAAVLTAVPTLVSGWMASSQLFGPAPQPPAIFVWHRAAAFTASGLAFVLLLWRAFSRDRLAGSALAASVALALLTAGVVGYTGYLGGQMVFGSQGPVHEELKALAAYLVSKR